jgi:hypothetical protein
VPSAFPGSQPSAGDSRGAAHLSELSDDDLESFRPATLWAARKRAIGIGAIAVLVGGGILIRLMSGGPEPEAPFDKGTSSEQAASPAAQDRSPAPSIAPPAPSIAPPAQATTTPAKPTPSASSSARPSPSGSASAQPADKPRKPGTFKPRVNETLGI